MNAPQTVPRSDQMRKFVLELRPEGLLAMTAINPKGGTFTRTYTRTFEIPDEVDALVRWVEKHNDAGRNVYFTPNRVKKRIAKKASVEDVAQVDYVFTDIDPDTRQGYQQGRDELLTRAQGELRTNGLTPAFIVDSGNGVNVLYRLSEPLTDKERGKRVNQRLVAALGGDKSAVDVSRILRMPYTTNYPSKTKLEKGYPETPATSSVLHSAPDVTYSEEVIDTWFQRSGSSPPTPANRNQPLGGSAIEKPDPNVTLDDVKVALSELDPGMPEAGWKDVGMIMCHQGQGHMAWLNAWDAWSSGGHNYQGRHDLESRWNSWKNNNGKPGKRLKVGTLFKMVREVDPSFIWPSELEFEDLDDTSPWPTAAELGFTDCLDYIPTDSVGKIFGPADALRDYPSPQLIDGLISLYEVTFIYGDPKAGKTTFWIEMERRIARGESLGQRRVEMGAVLHYTFEGSKAAMKKQRAMIRHGLLAEDDPFYLKTPHFTLDEEGAFEKILDDIRQINGRGISIRALCFDTLAAAAGQVDENSVKEMQPTLKLLSSLAVRYPLAIVVIHHAPKNKSGPRGSSAIRGMYDTGLEVSKTNGLHQMKVADQRDNDSEGKTFPFLIVSVEGIHTHPQTGKVEVAGLYSRQPLNGSAIPLTHEAEKLQEALRAVTKKYGTKRLEAQHVAEAKKDWESATGMTNRGLIRKRWQAAREQLEERTDWHFEKLKGRGNWSACLKDDFEELP